MLTARLRRRLAEATGNDAGITLMELIVAMVVATMVGAMTMLTFLAANKSVQVTGDRLLGTAAARNTLQSWQSLIQVADAPQTGSTCSTGVTAHRFEWITDNDMLLYANVANRDASGGCTPTQMVWLALRDRTLIEARYSYSDSAAGWARSVCRTLSGAPYATINAGALFVPDPGQFIPDADYGVTFAATSPFGSVTSCADAPDLVQPDSVKQSVPTANRTLAQVKSIGIAFTVADRSGEHRQSYDTTAAVYGGSS
jgi:hypothetical protein